MFKLPAVSVCSCTELVVWWGIWPWSHIRKCHLGGDTGVTPDGVFWCGWSVYAAQRKENCCADFIQCLCLRKASKGLAEMAVLCHCQLSWCKWRGLSVLLRTPQQTSVVLAQVLAAQKTGEWSNAFCVLEAWLAYRSGLMVINTGAPERKWVGKRRRMKAGCLQSNVYLSLPPTQGMAELLHNTTGKHLRNKIPSGREGKVFCRRRLCVSLKWFMSHRGAVGACARLLWIVGDMGDLAAACSHKQQARAPGCPQLQHYRSTLNSECLQKLQVLRIPMVRTEWGDQ